MQNKLLKENLQSRIDTVAALEGKIKELKFGIRDDARDLGYKVDFITRKLIKK